MNAYHARSVEPEFDHIAGESAFLLTACGDERIQLDPKTKRNRYGTASTPMPDEIYLSSSTASTITGGAFGAVGTALRSVSADSVGRRLTLDRWFDGLRSRILNLFGVTGADVVFAGSGTEAELIALAIAKCVLPGRLANIVVAPAETGSGVLQAAAGNYFLDSTPLGGVRKAGSPLEGWEDAEVEVFGVAIRDLDGSLRPAADIDSEVVRRVFVAFDAGHNVLLHRLETSKTGHTGVSSAAAAQISAAALGRVLVVVDCCQLRCSRRRIRQFLESGFMVAITGSKFFGGPAFSGALLIPDEILRRLNGVSLPAGLADYSARLDWPRDLRAKSQLRWLSEANIGLGLRWVAALHEMERFYNLPAGMRSIIAAHFERRIKEQSRSTDKLLVRRLEYNAPSQQRQSIFSFIMYHPDGSSFSREETATVHARLRQPGATFPSGARACCVFQLGQAVEIGPLSALRVCVSAPMISDIAARVRAGESLDEAFAQWSRDFEALFDKWRCLMGIASVERDARERNYTGFEPNT